MQTYGSLPIHGLIALHPSSSQPLYQQLYESLRAAILAGQLAGGTRLPSTRALAEELGASRSTVINAFDQLLAEGYIYGVRGSGTYVARVLPEELLQAPITPGERDHVPGANGALSQRGAVLSALPKSPVRDQPSLAQSRAFQVGLPAIDEFPHKLWGQVLARCWRRDATGLVIILSPKDDSLRLTRQPVTHDTVIQDTWLLWTRLAG